MLQGVACHGEEGLSQELKDLNWKRETLVEWNLDDALWLYSIRNSEVLRLWDSDLIRDDVLHRLFHMGIYDWSEADRKGPESTRAMRHATSMASCLLDRILSESKRWMQSVSMLIHY